MKPVKGRGHCILHPTAFSAGFTLVELMVVVALLGVVSAAAVPCFRTAQARYELDAAARQMAEDIRECQQVARGCRADGGKADCDSFKVGFDISRHAYSLRQNDCPFKQVQLPAGVELAGTKFSENLLFIKPNGTPLGQGGTVSLRSRITGEYLYVVVAPISGRVRVSSTAPGEGEIE
ncbi:pilus assembly FimT family protein [Desulfotomaculum copahuensis]|uniref:Type II secretion system protein GspH n=1 Tax=Desulfotomaculum copahuensis TaxID=1838280 RepID=A0A1B7LBJ8_9FIRM|nr:type II secretion system protein [Desulfotomaculum copahuensis]OAT79860.1 type II secretion system protein GspH [Desulfotomaculum copahuensis]